MWCAPQPHATSLRVVAFTPITDSPYAPTPVKCLSEIDLLSVHGSNLVCAVIRLEVEKLARPEALKGELRVHDSLFNILLRVDQPTGLLPLVGAKASSRFGAQWLLCRRRAWDKRSDLIEFGEFGHPFAAYRGNIKQFDSG